MLFTPQRGGRRGIFFPPVHSHHSLNILNRTFCLLFTCTSWLNPKESQGQWMQWKAIERGQDNSCPVSQADHRASAPLSSGETMYFTLEMSLLRVMTVKIPFYNRWCPFVAWDYVSSKKLQKVFLICYSVYGSSKSNFFLKMKFIFWNYRRIIIIRITLFAKLKIYSEVCQIEKGLMLHFLLF